jgi:DGQHR domain-containing protein
MKPNREAIVLRALETTQGEDVKVYAFFAKGAEILEVADISRIERDADGDLKGFQRPEIANHVRGIVEYLNQGKVLFPNAIILALSPEVKFVPARGLRAKGEQGIARSGTLSLPILPKGERVAWIVDGQQRSLALRESRHGDLPVPVVGFVSSSLGLQREQFILVNKARPLPVRLINELLPETDGIYLPKDLSISKIPSQLCAALNTSPSSPFFGLIRRPSDGPESKSVVTDTALIAVIRRSMSQSLGALAPFRGLGSEPPDTGAMYQVLASYWHAVKTIFPDAWGLDPRRSRLMHSAGIQAMGTLMDRIYARLGKGDDTPERLAKELGKIAPHCRWVNGTWEAINVPWNEIQNTPKDIKRLADVLIHLYMSGTNRL